MMEKVLGIHRDKLLPDFAGESFVAWLKRNPLPVGPERPATKVVLFPSCFVNYYNPGPGRTAVAVLAKTDAMLNAQAKLLRDARAGWRREIARRQPRTNIESMLPLVHQGYKVAAINPTCSLMMGKEYPNLLPGAEVKEFAAAVVDPHEVLWRLKSENLFCRAFLTTREKSPITCRVISRPARSDFDRAT